MTINPENYKVVEENRVNPYGDRIELKAGLKHIESEEIKASMTVGLSRHQVEDYDLQERLKRYKDRLIGKLEARKNES